VVKLREFFLEDRAVRFEPAIDLREESAEQETFQALRESGTNSLLHRHRWGRSGGLSTESARKVRSQFTAFLSLCVNPPVPGSTKVRFVFGPTEGNSESVSPCRQATSGIAKKRARYEDRFDRGGTVLGTSVGATDARTSRSASDICRPSTGVQACSEVSHSRPVFTKSRGLSKDSGSFTGQRSLALATCGTSPTTCSPRWQRASVRGDSTQDRG
jgi:hypothetical protein